MIFNWLWSRLPKPLVAPVCACLYAVSILLLWSRWAADGEPFRYIGL